MKVVSMSIVHISIQNKNSNIGKHGYWKTVWFLLYYYYLIFVVDTKKFIILGTELQKKIDLEREKLEQEKILYRMRLNRCVEPIDTSRRTYLVRSQTI
jgi:hypothetical protein